MFSMTPLHSWLLVLAVFVIVAGLLVLMLMLDAHLNNRAELRAAEDQEELAPVIDLDAKRQARELKLAHRRRLVPNEAPYDWKIQGL